MRTPRRRCSLLARDAMFAARRHRQPRVRPLARPQGTRKHLEDARERIAALLGARPDEVIFTSGGTEANNLAITGLAGRHVVASPMEHPCVIEPLKKLDAELTWLSVSPDGVVRFDESVQISNLTFVTVQMVNHETGAIQPVSEIAAKLPTGARFHTDAAQAVGKAAGQLPRGSV